MLDGRRIRIWKQVHIGVAMDFGRGLVVPKVRNADTKSVTAIAAELDDLAARAVAGDAAAEDHRIRVQKQYILPCRFADGLVVGHRASEVLLVTD